MGKTEAWREINGGGWASFFALIFIFIWQLSRFLRRRLTATVALHHDPLPTNSIPTSQFGTLNVINDADLKSLIDELDGDLCGNEKWDNVVERRNNLLYYNAKCCKPKDGPLKYLSQTVFENCSTEMLRDFYMDNDYRKKWDKTVIEHEQLQVEEITGTEIGCTIKKFPLLKPREYVLAWRVWEGKEKTFYCLIKDCEHPLAPRQKKYVRVEYFKSGWRIKKVKGRDACEIKMVHQEDAGLNVEMAKLAFAKGIWSYVCKMDDALHRHSSIIQNPQLSSSPTAVTLIQKVPRGLELDIINTIASPAQSTASSSILNGEGSRRKPSKKSIAKGLLLVGGIICLSRGHSSLGAKVALACVLKKLAKHSSSSSTQILQS